MFPHLKTKHNNHNNCCMWEISMMKIDCIVFLQVCYFICGLADSSGTVRILPYQFIIFLYVMQYVILRTAKYFSEENAWKKMYK